MISPSSRIKISSDSYIYRFFIRVFGSARLPKLASTISSPRAWVTGRRTRQCGRMHSSLSSDFDDVCHCEGKCAERGTSSRIKISSDSYIYRFFIRVFGSARLPKLASTISSPRAWVTGRRTRHICGRSSLSSDFDDVCHCEGKCAERGTSSRNGCRRSCQHRLCCGIRTVRDKDLKTQETHLW